MAVLCAALTTSYDTHAELLGKSQKGLEFYRKLAHNVAALAARARSVCQVQREEREEHEQRRAQRPPATVAASSAPTRVLDSVPTPTSGGTLKLKDYLPYMKNRSLGRSQVPQGGLFLSSENNYNKQSKQIYTVSKTFI